MLKRSDQNDIPVILCIEDEDHLRADIADELDAAGYRAVVAKDGREAIDLLPDLQPDLILCDITMPRVDGYGVLKTLRQSYPDLVDVPFVFLTALDQREEETAGKRAGADDYLVKPIDYDLMLATVESRLRQVHRIDERHSAEISRLQKALSEERHDGTTDRRSPAGMGLRSVLETLSFGVVLLRETEVEFANRTARGFHQAADGLIVGATLSADTPGLARALRTRLKEVWADALAQRDHLSSLSLERPSGRRDYLLTFAVVPGSPEEGDQTVVFITDPEARPAMPETVLMGAFGLTPTEAQIARALVKGRRSDEIAEDFSISATTVAFHLRNLFEKTGTNRQADLIVLLLSGLAAITADQDPG